MDKENPDRKHSDRRIPEIPPIGQIREELARVEAKYGFWKTLWNVTAVLLVAAAVTALLATRLFVLIRINGNSMEPGMSDRDIIVIHQT